MPQIIPIKDLKNTSEKSVSSIDAEIAKTQEELAKLKERYDKMALV